MGVKEFWKKKSFWQKIAALFIMIIIIAFVVLVKIFIESGVPIRMFGESFVTTLYMSKDIEYSGTVEFTYFKGVAPIVRICGSCFGKGYPYEEKSERTGECCFDLHGKSIEEDYQIEPYQRIKIRIRVMEIKKIPPIAYNPNLLFFSVKEILSSEPLTLEDCESVNYKSSCYEYFAEKMGNSSLCEKVIADVVWEGASSDRCISKSATSVEECEKIDSEMGDWDQDCYEKLAKLIKSPDLCTKIDYEERMEKCISEIYASVTSEEVCEGAEQYWPKCWHILAKNLNNPEFCNMLKKEDFKEDCIVETAKSIEDCKSIKSLRIKCYIELAARVNNPDLCNEIEDEDLKNSCIIGAAKSTEDCKEINSSKTECYIDPTFINRFEGECKSLDIKTKCYTNLAKKLKDIDLCNEIEDNFFKSECEVNSVQPMVDDCKSKGYSNLECQQILTEKLNKHNLRINIKNYPENFEVGRIQY